MTREDRWLRDEMRADGNARMLDEKEIKIKELCAEVEAFRGKLAEQCGQTLVARAEVERLREAAMPFAAHDWMDADLEDDNCKLTKGSGPITVGHWRALRRALEKRAD